MDSKAKEKIEKIIYDRKRAHKFFVENSRVYKSFVEMEERTFSKGHLDKKSKELIALGISIHKNCESCMEWHMKQALDSGATKEQILEAIEVGMEMGGGPATVSSRFALQVLEHYTNQD
ncbi:MAG: carboxymuconolactone decarboxylase family protein [Candidatus Aminicenantes bacterium]|nr:carboxymuconolactone decarboxylase family protein [Candidatus Aminicenantes bacterium]